MREKVLMVIRITSLLSFLFISERKKFLSKAFSMSEMDLNQILKLNYYKNYKDGAQMMLMEIVLVLTCKETH